MKKYKLYMEVCKSQKWLILLGIIFMIMNTIATIRLPFMMNEAIEELFLLSENGISKFLFVFLKYIGVYIGQGILNYFSTIIFRRIGNNNTKLLAIKINEKILNSKKRVFEKTSQRDIKIVINDDVFNLGESGILLIYRFFYVILNLVSITYYMLRTNIYMTFLAILAFVVMMFIQKNYNNIIAKIIVKGREKSGDYLYICNKVIDDSDEHKKNGAKQYIENRFNISITQLLEQKFQLCKKTSGLELINLFFIIINMLIVFVGGSYFVIWGKLSISQLLTFNMYSNTLSTYLSQIPNLFIEKKEFDISYSRVNNASMIETYKEVSNANNTNEKINNIELREIEFKYDSNPVLTGFNGYFETGNIYTIVGANGTGKTTLINLMTGDYELLSGKIFINNIEENMYENKLYYEKCISEFTCNQVLYDDTIYNNIVLGRPADQEKINKICDVVNLNEWINKLENGLNTRIDEQTSNLSEGQKQKIALARFLVNEKQVLFLDEMEKNLDNETKIQVMDYLNKIKENKIIVLVTHDEYLMEKADINIRL